jgi:hypothetical protein
MTEDSCRPSRRAPIHFSSREEFEARPNYVAALRCASGDLDHIVGKYGFSSQKKLQCGLNGCNKWHWHGFVIATKSGPETHCGQDCGKREFGVSWDELHADFQRQERVVARTKLVSDLLRDRNELLRVAQDMQGQLLEGCSKVGAVFEELKKEPLLVRQLKSVLTDGGRILAEVKVDADIGAAPGQRGSNANVTTIGRIQGRVAAEKYESIGRRFEFGVIHLLLDLNEESIEALTDEQIAQMAINVQSIRIETTLAAEFIDAARQFLSPKNFIEIEKLKEVLPSRAKTSRLERIFARLPALFSD